MAVPEALLAMPGAAERRGHDVSGKRGPASAADAAAPLGLARVPRAGTGRSGALRLLRLVAALFGLTLLAACAGGENALTRTPDAPPASPNVAAAGEGSTVVALLLPLGAQGNAGNVAQSMKNAAELAQAETGASPIRLIVKDDLGTTQGARAAADAAIAEGAKVILGPLFAHSVAAAAEAARTAGVPVIAFSTDSGVAGSGVFLLSFLPQGDVERIVRYQISQGRRSFAALLPQTAYGSVAEAAFQQSVADAGARVAVAEHYGTDPARMAEAVKTILPDLSGADSVFIPDQPAGVRPLVQLLVTGGADLKRARPIGTGIWNDPGLIGDPLMEGAQFSGPEPSGWDNFRARYRQRYGAEPVRTATLSYDAVSLVSALVTAGGPGALSSQSLTRPTGFAGVDGIFRFLDNGTNVRGLAVMEIRRGRADVVSPAPRAFNGSQF